LQDTPLVVVNRDASSIAILEPRNNVGYRREDVPCARDGQIRDLLLELADNASFEQVSGLVPRDADRVLTAFAERAASIAVRGKDERELRAGLLAAAVALSLSDDERYVLPAVALLYRPATIEGRDPERAFAAVNDLTDGRAPAWSVSPGVHRKTRRSRRWAFTRVPTRMGFGSSAPGKALAVDQDVVELGST